MDRRKSSTNEGEDQHPSQQAPVSLHDIESTFSPAGGGSSNGVPAGSRLDASSAHREVVVPATKGAAEGYASRVDVQWESQSAGMKVGSDFLFMSGYL